MRWLRLNEKIKEQILAIRDSGVTNMFDVRRVQQEAYDLGFYELVVYLVEHKAEYIHFILTGDTKKNKEKWASTEALSCCFHSSGGGGYAKA